MPRILLLSTVAAAAVCGMPSYSWAVRQTPGSTTINRVVVRDSANRAQSERLALRLDSLRYTLENDRLSSGERDKVRDEMRKTFVELRDLVDVVRIPSRAPLRFREPTVAIAVQPYSTSGYLGVSFDGPSIDQNRRGERFIRFLDYPRIALVEPSSPAERAGIHEGDSLLAFNGDDVRQREFSLTRLLVPDQKIVVRVRRDGSPMDFSVTVEKAPAYVVRRMSPGARVAAEWPAPPAEPMPVMPAIPPTPEARAQSVWIVNNGVAGAKVETINEGLARTIGVKEGVLVLTVMPGSPAYASGLRDGDIIVRAAERSVASVRELREIIERQRGEDVKLGVLRDRKRVELTLSW
jgi:membrane-associated protease RseP (regulator of RpoE activity)